MFDATPSPPTHPLMQDPAFAAALRRCGEHPITLPNGMILLRRRLFGMSMTMLPRATPPPTLGTELARLGLAKAPVILSPETPCPLPNALRLRSAQEMIELPLLPCPEDQRARLHGKWRNQLTQAERNGLSVLKDPLPADPNHPVLVSETAQSRACGYANWPAPLTAAFAAEAPQQTHLFRALCRGEFIAHMLFLSHGGRVTYHLGQTTPKGRQTHAHNLLMWHAMRYFALRDVQSINLGIANPRTPELDRFKLRTGAKKTPTGGTWLYWRPFASG